MISGMGMHTATNRYGATMTTETRTKRIREHTYQLRKLVTRVETDGYGVHGRITRETIIAHRDAIVRYLDTDTIRELEQTGRGRVLVERCVALELRADDALGEQRGDGSRITENRYAPSLGDALAASVSAITGPTVDAPKTIDDAMVTLLAIEHNAGKLYRLFSAAGRGLPNAKDRAYALRRRASTLRIAVGCGADFGIVDLDATLAHIDAMQREAPLLRDAFTVGLDVRSAR